MNTIPLFDAFDIPILEFIYNNIRCTPLNWLFETVTHLGDGGIFWIAIAVILLCFKKTRKTGIMMGGALLLGLIFCNLTLKPLVNRIRPYNLMEQQGIIRDILLSSPPSDKSFPSGHTIGSFEGATVIFLQHKKWGIVALVTAALVAFSRLYLYVHYPTDVLAGMIMGILFAILSCMAVDFVYKKIAAKKELK